MSILEQAKKAALSLKDKVTLSQFERTLEEATSDENWNAPTRVLQEIADHTYNFNDFNTIMKHVWDKMSSEKKKWRKIIKSLTLLEYLLKNGSPRCIQEAKDEIYQIRRLQDFAYSEEGVDRGIGIREKAKIVVELISDEGKLEEERENAKKLREKIGGGQMQAISSDSAKGGFGGYGGSTGGFGKKMEGFGSGSAGSKGGSYGGYSSKDVTSGGFGTGSTGGGYDDAKRVSSWRTAGSKHEEKTTPTSTTTTTKTKEPEVEKKPKSTGNGLKPIRSPDETKKETQKQPIDLIDGDDEGGDDFDWDKAPTTNTTTTTTTKQQNDDEWGWDNAQTITPSGNQQQQQSTGQQLGSLSWGEPQKQQTPTPNITNIKDLYQMPGTQPLQQGSQGSRLDALDSAFNPQPQFQQPWGGQPQPQWGGQPQPTWGGQQPQYPVNQFQNLNIKPTTQPQFTPQPNLTTGGGFTMTQTTSTNLGGFDFGTKPVNQTTTVKSTPTTQKQPVNQDDGFDDFQTAEAKKKSMFTGLESGLVDLGDLSKEALEKEKANSKQQINQDFAGSNTFQLYSTKEDLDFFDSPGKGTGFGGAGLGAGFGTQPGAGFGPTTGFGGGNPGFGTNVGMNVNAGFGGNMGMNVNVNAGFGGGVNAGFGVGGGVNPGFGGNPGYGMNAGFGQPTNIGTNQGFQGYGAGYGNTGFNQGGFGYK